MENLPAPSARQPVSDLLPSVAMSRGELWHMFDTTKPDQKAALFNARTNWDFTTTDMYALPPIDVEQVLFFTEEYEDESGEIKTHGTVVFVSPDGIRCKCHSTRIVSGAIGIIQVYGPPPWIPPMKIKIVEGKKGVKKASIDVIA